MFSIGVLKSYYKKRKGDEKKNKGLFMETHTVAPAPSRDYYALHLYQKKLLWTRWKISHGPSVDPVQKEVSLDVFSKDVTLQNELTYIFGEDTTKLIQDLVNEKWSLISMPSNILQKILSYLSVPDILRLSQVCKRLSKECSQNDLWQTICKKQWKILLHNDIEKANLIGWKNIYLEKMRPRRYKAAPARQSRASTLDRGRIGSVTPLNTPDSRTTIKSNLTTNKRVKELKKTDSIRSSSEIFKVTSNSTGRSTDRTLLSFGPNRRAVSRNSEFRPTSTGKVQPRSTMDRRRMNQSSYSSISLVPVIESPAEVDKRKSSYPFSTSSSKSSSVRARSVSFQPSGFRNKLKTEIKRQVTGKFMRVKQ